MDKMNKKVERKLEEENVQIKLPRYGQDEIDGIMSKFEELVNKYNIRPDDLAGDGAVYYRNGNDGTDFDWKMNENTCEFMMFYKSTDLGFAKLYVKTDGSLDGYVWLDEGRGEGQHIHEDFTNEDGAKDFAVLCYYQADELGLFDVNVDSINWNEEAIDVYGLFADEDEEDEW